MRKQYRPFKEGEKIEIAFLFQAGTVWASWDSVYRACLEEEAFSVRLVLITRTTVEEAHSEGARQFLEEHALPYESDEQIDWESYCPHIVFIQFPYDAAFHVPGTLSLQLARRGSRVVYIPYGIEISDTLISRKDHFNSRVVENAWRIYVSGEGIYREYEKFCRNRRAVRVTGSPKFDSIFDREAFVPDPAIKARAKGRKIIVWKLHFPKKINNLGRVAMITPALDEYERFVEVIRAYRQFFFIMMPHPKILGRVVASDTQGDDSMAVRMRAIIDKVRKLENAVVDVAKDYRPSLYRADAIILDRSAVMIEAAMLKVPVLFMKNAAYAEPMVQPVQEVMDACALGHTCEDMKHFLDALEEGGQMDIDRRMQLVDRWFPFRDGRCGSRIAADLKTSLMEEVPGDGRPAVVLYGTGEVASYYMDKEGWQNPEAFRLLAISDSNPKKVGTDFFGHEIIAPGEIRKLDFDFIVIMTEPHFYEIQNYLINEEYLDDRSILRLDEFVADILGGEER